MTSGSYLIGSPSTPATTPCNFRSRNWSGDDDPEHKRPNKYTVTYSERFDSSTGQAQDIASGAIRYFNTSSSPYWQKSMFAPLTVDTNASLKLENKLFSKIKGSGFNASISLAEGAESVKMLKDSGTSILKSLISFKRGNFSKAFDHLFYGNLARGRRIARFNVRKRSFQLLSMDKKWLSWQNGWKPLLSDCYEALNAIDALHRRVGSNLSRFSASRSESAFKVSSVSSVNGVMYANAFTQKRTRITAHVENPALAAMLGTAGVTDPLSVGWELLPYSSCVDWFLPVGTYLETRGLAQLVKATFVTSTKMQQILTNPVLVNRWKNITQTRAYWRETSFTRSVSSSIDVTLPGFRNPLGFDQVLTAFSLLTSRFHR